MRTCTYRGTKCEILSAGSGAAVSGVSQPTQALHMPVAEACEAPAEAFAECEARGEKGMNDALRTLAAHVSQSTTSPRTKVCLKAGGKGCRKELWHQASVDTAPFVRLDLLP